jgi:hypothetical protein
VVKKTAEELDVESELWPEGLNKSLYFYTQSFALLAYIRFWQEHDFRFSISEMTHQHALMLTMTKLDAITYKTRR